MKRKLLLTLCAITMLLLATSRLRIHSSDCQINLSRDHLNHRTFTGTSKEKATYTGSGRDSVVVNSTYPDSGLSSKEEDFTQLRGPIPGFPFNTSNKIRSQNTINGMIKETQTLHFQIFNDLIKDYKYVVLVNLAATENKGDSAIGVGELLLIKRLKKELIYQCEASKCTEESLEDAKTKALQYGVSNVVVLCHGGGNLLSYTLIHDQIRFRTFRIFESFKTVVFPQSIWLTKPDQWEVVKGAPVYAEYPNVTILIRDAQSLERAYELLPKNNLILCPDIAFQIGSVPRSLQPQYDIVWVKRTDYESTGYQVSDLDTHGLSVKIADWLSWMPAKGFEDILEKINIQSEMGFVFLQRGRVAITDRLHGHILSTMLHMPHVLLDTSDHKLAAYHNTWTKGLEGDTVVLAKTPQEALDKARDLINRF